MSIEYPKGTRVRLSAESRKIIPALLDSLGTVATTALRTADFVRIKWDTVERPNWYSKAHIEKFDGTD